MNETALHTWGRTVATILGAQFNKSGSDFVLTPLSETWQRITGISDPIQICAEPQDKTSWKNRLRFVEQSAAQALLAGPVGFACELENGHSKLASVYRLALGLSLSTGHACRRRYTLYSHEGSVFFTDGSDCLFDHTRSITALDLKRTQFLDVLAEVCKPLSQIATSYASDTDVAQQVESLNKKLAAEMRDLDRLYLSGHGKHARLIGNALEGLHGEDAIEAEYLGRLRDIVARYQVSICFEPLTFSLINCRLQQRKTRSGIQIKLPFVEQPLIAVP